MKYSGLVLPVPGSAAEEATERFLAGIEPRFDLVLQDFSDGRDGPGVINGQTYEIDCLRVNVPLLAGQEMKRGTGVEAACRECCEGVNSAWYIDVNLVNQEFPKIMPRTKQQ
eukprot:Skav205485  [mRNA]  locus=scaffold830:447182:448196:- [translate_table: standard]